ncbi:diacylglycerol/lipid kinase family protein [Flavitalea sp.]|nr:diacylglycerol kinase family protein [Flavitalea sp.]
MQKVHILHNPGAGDEKYTREHLIELLENNGYQCSYMSTKQDKWKNFDTNADLLIVAGGDGTVRKVAGQILNRQLLDKPRALALLPLGTANNIGRSLKLNTSIEEAVNTLHLYQAKPFDIGRIYNVPGAGYFLESFGFGVFPALIEESKKKPDKDKAEKTLQEKIQLARKRLYDIVVSYEPVFCKIEIDSKEYSGRYLLIEVMNTPSIGPKLDLSPVSDPGDGSFEVVMVSESDRQKFLDYLSGKISESKDEYNFETIKGKHIKISWDGNQAHVDDKFIELENGIEVTIRLRNELLAFLTPLLNPIELLNDPV